MITKWCRVPRTPQRSHTNSSPVSEPPSAADGNRHLPSTTGLPRNASLVAPHRGRGLQTLLRPLSLRCRAPDLPPLFYQPEDVILLADRDASHAPVLHTNERLEEALGRWMSRITVMPKLARNRLPSLRVDQRADDRIISTPRLLVRPPRQSARLNHIEVQVACTPP